MFPLLASLGTSAEFQLLKPPNSSNFLSPLRGSSPFFSLRLPRTLSLPSFYPVSPSRQLIFSALHLPRTLSLPPFYLPFAPARRLLSEIALSSFFTSLFRASSPSPVYISPDFSLLVLPISTYRPLFTLLSHLHQDASVSSSFHRDYSSSLTNPSDQDMIHKGAMGDTMQAPAPVTGRAHVNPGEWAALALGMNWACAKRGSHIKTPLLQALSRMPPRREPTVRLRLFVNGFDLMQRIGARKQNVEAFVIQTVGDVALSPCTHCESGNGPFPVCVTVQSSYGQRACGACHWDNQGSRCRFAAVADHSNVAESFARPVPQIKDVVQKQHANLMGKLTTLKDEQIELAAMMSEVNDFIETTSKTLNTLKRMSGKMANSITAHGQKIADLEQQIEANAAVLFQCLDSEDGDDTQ